MSGGVFDTPVLHNNNFFSSDDTNIFDTIWYKIIFLKVGIFDSNTNFFNGFWLKLIIFWLIRNS